MSDAQLQASGWSWTRPNAIYVPDSAGDYAEIATVISGSVKTGRLAGALEGMSEMIEVTGAGIVPPAEFTRWTLGNDHSQAAATQFWGSVLQLRIN